jgi:hypothetical protein
LKKAQIEADEALRLQKLKDQEEKDKVTESVEFIHFYCYLLWHFAY